MKIIYLGNFNNKFSDQTEKHISYAFKQLGHEVVEIDENGVDLEKLATEKGNLFLFHKATNIEIPELLGVLNNLPCKKVFWYFDKIWGDRELWIKSVLPFVDYGFITDETWARRHSFKNLKILRQGIGNEDTSLGEPRMEYTCSLAFLGSIYGERMDFIKQLQSLYGKDLKVYNNIFNRDLYDFCASCKLLIAPPYPSDDYYWSSRIYMVLGSGGALIHPVLEGLKEEFEEGVDYVGYRTGRDFIDKLNYYFDPDHPEHKDELDKIRETGYQKVINNYTYKHRVEKMLNTIYGK
jgi:hypothetical protein